MGRGETVLTPPLPNEPTAEMGIEQQAIVKLSLICDGVADELGYQFLVSGGLVTYVRATAPSEYQSRGSRESRATARTGCGHIRGVVDPSRSFDHAPAPTTERTHFLEARKVRSLCHTEASDQTWSRSTGQPTAYGGRSGPNSPASRQTCSHRPVRVLSGENQTSPQAAERSQTPVPSRIRTRWHTKDSDCEHWVSLG
jgi:hypothetical protein